MTKKIIYLDPGHPSYFKNGKINWGAVSASGLREVEINLQVGKILKIKLENCGLEVYLSRSNNNTPLDNVARINDAFKKNASFVLRLHCDQNTLNNITKNGLRTFFPPPQAKNIHTVSLKAARIIHSAIINKTQLHDNGIVDDREANIDSKIGMLIGTREADKYKIPTILIEMVYLSNPENSRWIAKRENQILMAEGICEGIINSIQKGII